MNVLGGGYVTAEVQPTGNSETFRIQIPGIPGTSKNLYATVDRPPKCVSCRSQIDRLVRNGHSISTNARFLENGTAQLVRPFDSCQSCRVPCGTTGQNIPENRLIPLFSWLQKSLGKFNGSSHNDQPITVIRTTEPVGF